MNTSIYTRPPSFASSTRAKSRLYEERLDYEESDIARRIRSRLEATRPVAERQEKTSRVPLTVRRQRSRTRALEVLSDHRLLDMESDRLVQEITNKTSRILQTDVNKMHHVFSAAVVTNSVSIPDGTVTIRIKL